MRFLLLAIALLIATPAYAERPEAPRFDAEDYGLTLGLGSLALVSDLFGPPEVARWRGGAIMDDSIRDGMRLGTKRSREVADTVSDVLLYSLQGYVLADAGMLMGREADDGYRVLMIDAQSYATSAALISLAKTLIGRERPFVRDCLPGEQRCQSRQTNKSFLSGHTAMAFTAAGLVCVHHAQLDLYGGGAADDIACGIAIGAASTTAILRMMADKHYSTDVIAGLAVGTFAGFVLPYLLHYGTSSSGVETTGPSAFPWLSAAGTF